MKTKTFLRGSFKKVIRDPLLYKVFPELLVLYNDLKKGKYKVTCCSFDKNLHLKLVEHIRCNTNKWLDYLELDRLIVYIDNKKEIFTK